MFNVTRKIANPYPSQSSYSYDNTISVGAPEWSFTSTWGHLPLNSLKAIQSSVQTTYNSAADMKKYEETFEKEALLSKDKDNYGVDVKSSNVDDCVKWCVYSAIAQEQHYNIAKKKNDDFWKTQEPLIYNGRDVLVLVRKETRGEETATMVIDEVRKQFNSPEWKKSPDAVLKAQAKSRGGTEEYRIPEDIVFPILRQLVYNNRR